MFRRVTYEMVATIRLSLPALGGYFIADAIADDLAFKLGKGKEDIQSRPPH